MLNKKYALNKEVCLLTSVYGIMSIMFIQHNVHVNVHVYTHITCTCVHNIILHGTSVSAQVITTYIHINDFKE